MSCVTWCDVTWCDVTSHVVCLRRVARQVGTLKCELSEYRSGREELAAQCGELKNKTRDLETMLSAREEDLRTLQQDNSRLSSHATNLDVCFSSLKEEKNKIVESLSQMVIILQASFMLSGTHNL